MPAPDLSGPGLSRLDRLGGFRTFGLVLLAILLAASTGLAADGAGLNEQERLGRQIYLEGRGTSEIVAVLAGNVEIPAAALNCGGCHGPDGQGRPEGGVSPSDLRRAVLARPYEVTTPSGRVHGPYDDRALIKAIALGLDPAGNALQPAMPRYRMSRHDMDALLAYLGRLGDEAEPGVADDVIRVGVLVPSEGPRRASARAISAVVAAYFDDLDEAGGIFGRRVERVEVPMDVDPFFQPEAVAQVLRDAGIFALVGGLLDETGGAWLEAADRLGIPWIGPRTLSPRLGFPLAREIFYIEPGLVEQSVTLAEHATERWPGRGARIVYPEGDELLLEAADALAKRLVARGQDEPERIVLGADGTATRPAATRDTPVFLLVPGPAGRRALQRFAGSPVLAPGPLAAGWFAGGSRPASELHLTFPVAPSDRDPREAAAWASLAERHTLSPSPSPVELGALAAAKIFSEGLRRTGGDPTRESFVASLETLRDFTTGLTPPVTYGPNRRIGLDGERVVILSP